MRKLILFLFLGFAAILAGGGMLFASREWLVKTGAVYAVKNLTGFDAAIQTLDLKLGPRNVALHFRGLTLLNPKGFSERIFADIPEIHFRMDHQALWKREGVYIPQLTVDVRELNIEKNPGGISNLSLLTSVKKTGEKKAGPAEKALPFQLDRFELTIRRVRYNDRSSMIPKRLSVDVKVQKQVFENIQDPHAVVNLIVMKVLMTTSFGNLGIDVSHIRDQIKNPVQTARQARKTIFQETGISETYQRTGALGKKGVTSVFGVFRPKRNSENSESVAPASAV